MLQRYQIPILSLVTALALSFTGARAAELADSERLLKLVGQLGADEFDIRQDAEDALSKAPGEAFEVLTSLYSKMRDAEIRERLRRILPHVCSRAAEKSRGKTVTLDTVKQPAREVLASVATQAGFERDALNFLIPLLGERTLTLKVNAMQDRHVLRWMLRLCGVNPDLARTLEERTYELKDMPLTAATLHRNVTEQWLAAEIKEAGRAAELDGTKLKMTASAEEHQQVEFILQQLREQKELRRIHIKLHRPPFREAMLQLLRNQKVSFEFVDKPFEDVLDYFRHGTGVPLLIDPRIADQVIPPVTLKVADMDCELALGWCLKLTELDLVYKDEVLMVSKPVIEPGPREFLVLDLGDMAKPGGRITLAHVADMIRNRVRPESWDAALGTGIEEADGKLLIAQSPEIVPHILELLEIYGDYLKMVEKVEPDGNPPARPLKPEDVPRHREARYRNSRKGERPEDLDRSWEKDLRAKLAKKISFNTEDTPLAEVIELFSKQTEVQYILDPRSVEEGFDKTPITLRVKDMSAETALRWVMRFSDLDFDLRSNAVFLTKRANLASNVELGIFYVNDLTCVFDAPNLVGIIKDNLMPVEFAHPATSLEESNGALVVMQTPQNLEHIQQILTWLRQNCDQKCMLLHRVSGLIQDYPEIRKKLEEKVSFTFEETPLREALSNLRDKLGITIFLDPRTEISGLPSVTLAVKDIPAHEALQLLLRLSEVNYALVDDAVFVAKPEHLRGLDFNVECGVYSVDGIDRYTVEEIADLLREKIHPKSWDPALGTSIEERSGKLVVMQNHENHKLIADALEKLRAQSK